MSTVAEISGDVVIGTAPNAMTIPLAAVLGAATKELLFKYQLPAGATPEYIVGIQDFIDWATSNLGLGTVTLPEGLSTLSIGVSHLLIDTNGRFEIGAEIGSMSKTGVWSSAWNPISGLSVGFSDLLIEVDYSKGPILFTSADAAAAATTLTFSATTGVTTGMTVSSSAAGIPAGCTVSGTPTATMVTLSAPLTAAVPSMTEVVFLPAS